MNYDELMRMVSSFPRPKRYELHCHPSVIAAMKDAFKYTDGVHLFLRSNMVSSIDVFKHDDMMPGWYEIRCDGVTVNGGCLTLPVEDSSPDSPDSSPRP